MRNRPILRLMEAHLQALQDSLRETRLTILREQRAVLREIEAAMALERDAKAGEMVERLRPEGRAHGGVAPEPGGPPGEGHLDCAC